jgi:hypothetical protein
MVENTKYENIAGELGFALLNLPPDFKAIREKLARWGLPSEVLSSVACYIADNFCSNEYQDALESDGVLHGRKVRDESGNIIKENLVSFYLPEMLAALLDSGMNPNDFIESRKVNIMWLMKYVDYKDYAARCLKLLLERGGNPNILVCGESLFELTHSYILLDVMESELNQFLSKEVPYWLVLLGFGGCWSDGRLPVTMQDGYQPEIFRNYDAFDWKIESQGSPNEDGTFWTMHIFNKSTGTVVAKW